MRRLRSVCSSALFGGGGGRDGLAGRRHRLNVRSRSSFGGSRRGRSSRLSSLDALDFSCRFRCIVRALFFGGRCRRVFSNASLIAGSAGDLALFSCSSFGTVGGDKRNTRHSDPAALRHEPGQGRSAAESNPEAIVNAILQPRPNLQHIESNMSAQVRSDISSRASKRE
jgi:hypothetical protein